MVVTIVTQKRNVLSRKVENCKVYAMTAQIMLHIGKNGVSMKNNTEQLAGSQARIQVVDPRDWSPLKLNI